MKGVLGIGNCKCESYWIIRRGIHRINGYKLYASYGSNFLENVMPKSYFRNRKVKVKFLHLFYSLWILFHFLISALW